MTTGRLFGKNVLEGVFRAAPDEDLFLGELLVAVDEATGRRVVLKTPAIDLQNDEAHLDRFVLEEWIARRIDSDLGGFDKFKEAFTQAAVSRFGSGWAWLSVGQGGKLVVETDRLLPGYLRKNGVPYSENARVNEFYSVYGAPQGDTWLVITTEVVDPVYLNSSFITSSHFKKLSAEDGERYWNPEPCSAR